MRKASAHALARRIERETDQYEARPYELYRFAGGAKIWSVKCTDRWTGYSFSVCSPERWEYLSTPPQWNDDRLWNQS